MPKPYDRVKNANNQSDVFIKTPYWTPEVEESFEVWAKGEAREDLASEVDECLTVEIAVSFKAMNGSVCCTLAHQPSKDANLPYLLTGWSDTAHDAYLVALFKLEIQLKGVWETPPQPKVTRRH